MQRFLFLIALVFATQSSMADCPAPPPYHGYRFLNPNLLDYDSNLYPFYAAFSSEYADADELAAELRSTANLREWHERYCQQVDLEDIQRLLYGNTAPSLKRIMALAGNPKTKSTDLPAKLQQNSFARHLVAYHCREVAQYLYYAKRVEPYVVARKKTFARQASAGPEMKRLLDEGLDYFKDADSHYVRLRYAYQTLRLAHYLGEYDYFNKLYDYLMPKVAADPSILYDWIESHHAGVLQNLGHYPESAYLFSRVFERCPSCRESAHRSFRIRSDEDWAAAYRLCANDAERAMLHVLRAQDPKANLIREMKRITLLDPDNRALEPLLMRELLELERELLGIDIRPGGRTSRTNQAAERLIELQAFVNQVVDAGTAHRPGLWLLARGSLEILAGQYFYADVTLEKLRQTSHNDSLLSQAEILQEVLDVLALDYVDDEREVYYYDLLNDKDMQARYPSLSPLVNDKLEAIYARKGQPAKAALLRYGFEAIRKNPQLPYLEELRGMADSLTGNAYDRGLLQATVGDHVEDELNHLTGLYYLQRGQWEIALRYLRRVSAARRDSYGRFAPFVKQFRDRVNFVPPPSTPTYDRVSLLERLEELETEARTSENDTVAARNFFNLGLAHYNMSYFSYNWPFADAFRSATSAARAAKYAHPGNVFPHPNTPLGNLENLHMERARHYFERAAARAPTREAAAEALYFAAKAERNQYFAHGRPGGRRPFTFFKQLHQHYANTRYYQTLISECRTFAWYAARQ